MEDKKYVMNIRFKDSRERLIFKYDTKEEADNDFNHIMQGIEDGKRTLGIDSKGKRYLVVYENVCAVILSEDRKAELSG